MTSPTHRDGSGQTWWTMGAQKGVYQPPYAVKWRGRWWRTHSMTAPTGEPRLSADDLARIRALPQLALGNRRVLDYLSRTGKRFRDLPLLNASALPPVVAAVDDAAPSALATLLARIADAANADVLRSLVREARQQYPLDVGALDAVDDAEQLWRERFDPASLMPCGYPDDRQQF